MKLIHFHPDKDPKDHPDYEIVLDAMKRNKLKVNCPWWAKDHFENKPSGEIFEGCTYLIE